MSLAQPVAPTVRMKDKGNLSPQTLRWKEKIGYASGDFASCLYFGVFANFLTYFYTDIFGLSAMAVGVMILITRSYDWIDDPIFGIIADRTKSKHGKYRPWLIWMIVPYIGMGVIAFTTFDLSNTWKLVYAYVTYTLLTIVYTAVNVPYSALMGVMTPNSAEKTELASYRFVGAFLGTLVVGSTLLYLVDYFGQGDDQSGFTKTILCYGILAGFLFFLTFKLTKERVVQPPTQDKSVKSDIQSLFKNGPWLVLFVVSVLTIMVVSLRSGVTIHYFKYVSGNENWGALFLTTSSAVQVAFVLLTPKIAKWLGGKKRAFLYINLSAAIFMALFYFIDPTNLKLIIAHQVVSCLFTAPLAALFWSMLSDTADYGAHYLGQRANGLLFSAGTCSQKIGWTVGPALAIWFIGYRGFVANEEQSLESLQAMTYMMSLIPAVFALLAAFAVLFYKIDAKMEKELEAKNKALVEVG